MAISEYYYMLHDGDTDYDVITIENIEGENISNFSMRIVAANEFCGCQCIVYPLEDASGQLRGRRHSIGQRKLLVFSCSTNMTKPFLC
jgi:hypothetical protein